MIQVRRPISRKLAELVTDLIDTKLHKTRQVLYADIKEYVGFRDTTTFSNYVKDKKLGVIYGNVRGRCRTPQQSLDKLGRFLWALRVDKEHTVVEELQKIVKAEEKSFEFIYPPENRNRPNIYYIGRQTEITELHEIALRVPEDRIGDLLAYAQSLTDTQISPKA